MFSSEDLTNAIIKAHEEQGSENSINNVINVVKGLYEWDTWIWAAAGQIHDGQMTFQGTYIPHLSPQEGNGYYLVIYSHMKYFTHKFSSSAAYTSIRAILKVFVENFNRKQCSGIIVNPETEAELVLTPLFIHEVFLQLGFQNFN